MEPARGRPGRVKRAFTLPLVATDDKSIAPRRRPDKNYGGAVRRMLVTLAVPPARPMGRVWATTVNGAIISLGLRGH